MFLVVLATPVEMVDFELEAALAPGQRMQHLDPGRYHFRADPVARNSGDLICLHRGLRDKSAASKYEHSHAHGCNCASCDFDVVALRDLATFNDFGINAEIAVAEVACERLRNFEVANAGVGVDI